MNLGGVEVEFVDPPNAVLLVAPPDTSAATLVLPVPGPPGPPGVAGGYQLLTQAAPAATWTFTHSLGRIPSVQVLDSAGDVIEPDVTVTATTVSVTFPAPATGALLLT